MHVNYRKSIIMPKSSCLWFLAAFFFCTVHAAPTDAPAVAADRLSEALARGDQASVERLLDEEVLIYESGGQERSLEEYSSHHLPADIAFMSSMHRQVLSRKVFQLGEGAAVVATRVNLSGRYKDKTIDDVSTETLVLRRQDDGWKIVHIHWSSR